ncbi:MAG: hypothetical protein CMF62_01285 [Magnetococcales bacterium]|nr:hypothetical protein [Magnetococcales bacterium]MBA42627.1 hypothetical protein [Magnetococcales bacterium]
MVSIGKSTITNVILKKYLSPISLKKNTCEKLTFDNNNSIISDYPVLCKNNISKILDDEDIIIYVMSIESFKKKKEKQLLKIVCTNILDKINNGKIINLIIILNKCDNKDRIIKDYSNTIKSIYEYLDNYAKIYSMYIVSGIRMMVKNIKNDIELNKIPKNIKCEVDIKQDMNEREKKFIETIDDLCDDNYWDDINIYHSLKFELDTFKSLNDIVCRIETYSNYTNIEKVSNHFDKLFYTYICKSSTLNNNLFNLYDRFKKANKLTGLNDNEIYQIFTLKLLPFQKINNQTMIKFVLNKFINERIYNFLNFKFYNGKKVIELINNINIYRIINNRDLIIDMHTNLDTISKKIDCMVVEELLKEEYDWNIILSLNSGMNYALLSYINLSSLDSLKKNIHKLYGRKRIDIESKIMKYEPIVKKFKIENSKLQYYHTKMLLFLTLHNKN